MLLHFLLFIMVCVPMSEIVLTSIRIIVIVLLITCVISTAVVLILRNIDIIVLRTIVHNYCGTFISLLCYPLLLEQPIIQSIYMSRSVYVCINLPID